MKKITSAAAVALAVILTVTLALAGCGKKQKETLFVKQLVSSSNTEAELLYISDDQWEKEAEQVEIPGAPEQISVTTGTEQKIKTNGYYYHRIPIKVESRKLQKTGRFGKPFEFEKVKITWDDGSSSTEKIGTIRITDGKKRNGLKRSESGQMRAGKGWIQYTDYQVKKRMKIIHMEIPFAEEEGALVPRVSVNAVSAQAIDKKHPLKLHKGEACTVESRISEELTKKYGRILLEGEMVTVDGNKKKQKTEILIDWDGFGRQDPENYLSGEKSDKQKE